MGHCGYLETKKAVQRALSGEGPTLIEAGTYRHGGHHVNDPGLYMDQEVLAEWKARDPIDSLSRKIGDQNKIKNIQEAVESELAEAIQFAKNRPPPSVEEFLATIPNF